MLDESGIWQKLDHPTSRKVIAVVDRTTYEQLDWDSRARDFWLRAGVLVLPEDLDVEKAPVLESLAARGLWERGAILAQNPYYTHLYERGDEPQVLFARSRLRVMALVLQALGARQLQYREADARHEDVHHKGEGGVEHLKVKGKAGFSRQQAEDLRRSVTVDYTWSGGAPDVEAASQLLRDTNLHGDDALTSLIRLRSNSHNEHRELVETFDLLHESSSTIELAAELKAGLTGGKAKGARSKKRRYEYKVSYKIAY